MNSRQSVTQRWSKLLGCSLWFWTSVAGAQQTVADPQPATEAPAPDAPAEGSPGDGAPLLGTPLPLTDALRAELNDYIAAALVSFDVPGAAVAVIRNGDIEHTACFGVRDVDQPEAIDLETRFMIGSVTKTLTTTLASTLVDEGRLDWDDLVSDYLPTFGLSNPEWTPLVRLRDVFSHTSGVPRSDLVMFFDAPGPLELIDSVTAMPNLAAPGLRYEYQNQVFTLGGFALARAGGAAYTDRALASGYTHLLQRRVFDPLDMARSTANFEAAVADANHSQPHGYDPLVDDVRPMPLGFERLTVAVAAAGGVWSNVGDMARFLAMHLREGQSMDGVQLFPEQELLETHTAQASIQDGLSYGLGWLISHTNPVDVLWHDGGTAGFTARVLGLPSNDWGLVILTNRSGGSLFQEAVTRYAIALAFGTPHVGDADLLELDAQSHAAYAELLARTAPVAPDAAVEDYLGSYERGLSVAQTGEELTIGSVYGELRFRAVTGLEDTFLDVDNVLGGVAAQFSTDEQGRSVLSLGGVDFETGEVLYPIRATRLGTPRNGQRKRHPSAAAFLRLARPLHLRQGPWAPVERRRPW